jgi:hypothetical protein
MKKVSTLMNPQKVEKRFFLSFRRRPESRKTEDSWTPAFAGVTAWKTFNEVVNFRHFRAV